MKLQFYLLQVVSRKETEEKCKTIAKEFFAVQFRAALKVKSERLGFLEEISLIIIITFFVIDCAVTKVKGLPCCACIVFCYPHSPGYCNQ